jgi:hypothetical protein
METQRIDLGSRRAGQGCQVTGAEALGEKSIRTRSDAGPTGTDAALGPRAACGAGAALRDALLEAAEGTTRDWPALFTTPPAATVAARASRGVRPTML